MTFFAGDVLAAADLNAMYDLVFNPPLCKLTQQSGQSINNNAATALTFGSGSETIKTHSSMHSTSSNTTRIVVPQAGIYQVKAQGYWAFSTTINYCDVLISQNGSTVGRSGNLMVGAASNVSHNGGAIVEEFTAAANDYFEASLFHVSTGSVAQTTNAAAGAACRFSVAYLRP